MRQLHKVSWQVIEFNSVKSLQKGTLTTLWNATTHTVTVSAVDLTKSILVFNHTNNTGNGDFHSDYLNGYMSNGTTLNFYQKANAKTIKWQLIEFN